SCEDFKSPSIDRGGMWMDRGLIHRVGPVPGRSVGHREFEAHLDPARSSRLDGHLLTEGGEARHPDFHPVLARRDDDLRVYPALGPGDLDPTAIHVDVRLPW